MVNLSQLLAAAILAAGLSLIVVGVGYYAPYVARIEESTFWDATLTASGTDLVIAYVSEPKGVLRVSKLDGSLHPVFLQVLGSPEVSIGSPAAPEVKVSEDGTIHIVWTYREYLEGGFCAIDR